MLQSSLLHKISAKNLPKYSLLHFKESQQIKQFMRKNTKHPAEFSNIFLKKIHNFDASNPGLSGLDIQNMRKNVNNKFRKKIQNCWLYFICVT